MVIPQLKIHHAAKKDTDIIIKTKKCANYLLIILHDDMQLGTNTLVH